MAAPAVVDKADNAFMMICTALVLFMTIPGIALFYGGLIRGKNVLSMLTQVAVTFALVCILWVVYGYSLAFGEGNNFFGDFNWVMLKNIELTAVMGSFYQYIHVAFQGSFACITVGLIVGALAERIRFSAVLIFVVVWLTLSYIPIAHMGLGRRFAGFSRRAGFCGRYGRAYQCSDCWSGGRLSDWQTCRLW
ncbi:ammonium transporter [Citrobacter koseri]|nr:ammonium transporter [Citrobacter koseri]